MLSNTTLIDEQIGQIVQAHRKHLRLTAVQVARRMNRQFHFKWTGMHVARTEKGERKLGLVEGFALAQVLGLDIFQLVGIQPIDG